MCTCSELRWCVTVGTTSELWSKVITEPPRASGERFSHNTVNTTNLLSFKKKPTTQNSENINTFKLHRLL